MSYFQKCTLLLIYSLSNFVGGSIGGEGSGDSATDRISATVTKSDPDLRHTIDKKNEIRGKDFPEKSASSKSAPSHLKFSKEQMKMLGTFSKRYLTYQIWLPCYSLIFSS